MAKDRELGVESSYVGGRQQKVIEVEFDPGKMSYKEIGDLLNEIAEYLYEHRPYEEKSREAPKVWKLFVPDEKTKREVEKVIDEYLKKEKKEARVSAALKFLAPISYAALGAAGVSAVVLALLISVNSSWIYLDPAGVLAASALISSPIAVYASFLADSSKEKYKEAEEKAKIVSEHLRDYISVEAKYANTSSA